MPRPTPSEIPPYTVIRGASSVQRVTFLDPDGTAIDLTAAGKTVRARYRDSAGTLVELSQGVGTEAAYATDGTDGIIDFLLSQAATLAMPVGRGDMELLYEDNTTTPLTREVAARGVFIVEDPETGSLD